MVDAVFLSSEEPELVRAWQTFPDPVLAHPSGEVLQYMETVRRGTGWAHVFRHRCHPATGERTSWRVEAPRGWLPTMR
jgi:hypothetical protein